MRKRIEFEGHEGDILMYLLKKRIAELRDMDEHVPSSDTEHKRILRRQIREHEDLLFRLRHADFA